MNSIESLKREGEKIAEKLGNGVTYLGPQVVDGKFLYHFFNDNPAFTGTAFTAITFEEAKQKLIGKRKLFSMPLPDF